MHCLKERGHVRLFQHGHRGGSARHTQECHLILYGGCSGTEPISERMLSPDIIQHLGTSLMCPDEDRGISLPADVQRSVGYRARGRVWYAGLHTAGREWLFREGNG